MKISKSDCHLIPSSVLSLLYGSVCSTAARAVTRYCVPQGSSDLPHVTRQLDTLLDTFSADWTIVMAYRRTESLRCVQYVAARELPETQDPFYKRWLLNRTAELAASRGDLPTVQWLMEIYVPVEPVDYVVEVAAAFGHLDMLQWFYDHHLERVQFGLSEMCGALGGKHEHVVSWLREHAEIPVEWRSKMLRAAARAGNMSSNGCVMNVDWMQPMDVAAAHGLLEVAKWLYWNWNVMPTAMTEAAGNGHLNVVQWIFETRGSVYPFSDATLASVFVRAAQYGRLDVIQWLHTRCCGSCGTIVMDYAASRGYLDVVKWLHENRSEGCSEKAMDKAAVNGHLDVVKYLHEHRSVGCTVDAMDGAASKGHLEIVKWLSDHRSEGCSTRAMNCAAYNGHFDILQWLHANRTEGCTSRAMDDAAEDGHLNIVKSLHENRSEGCTCKAMDKAARTVTWKLSSGFMPTVARDAQCLQWTRLLHMDT